MPSTTAQAPRSGRTRPRRRPGAARVGQRIGCGINTGAYEIDRIRRGEPTPAAPSGTGRWPWPSRSEVDETGPEAKDGRILDGLPTMAFQGAAEAAATPR